MEELEEEKTSVWWLALSSVMLIAGVIIQYNSTFWTQHATLSLVYYLLAFLPVGIPVVKEAWEYLLKHDYFSEFMLMSIATLGAFIIGEYPEAVAVMLLYSIGEALQDRAVDKARDNIKSLVAFRPDQACVVEGDKKTETDPQAVPVGAVIEVLPGGRVPLDGTLITDAAAFNTAALTGESVPRTIEKGHEVLAAMIPVEVPVRLRVTRPSHESAISRILNMVEEASNRKAQTELFIRRFAHVYTPAVILLAFLTVLVPWLWSLGSDTFSYDFYTWFKRSLIFLVISCPCALVISIPLGYFGGIGAASRRGILFKGGNCLDAIAQVDTVAFDKTGTLTTGEFSVKKVMGLTDDEVLMVSRMELTSTHPIAKAINRYCPVSEPADTRTIAGYGLQSGSWLAGTLRLLDKEGVTYPAELRDIPETLVAVAKDGTYRGCLLLADTLKADAAEAIADLHMRTQILSGDKQQLVNQVAEELHTEGYGDLLPEGKVAHIEQLKRQGHRVAFVGDGINDAPVLATADVGVAMGAMGSDMAIETADVIIQTDQPSKVAEAVRVARRTRRIVYQNIVLAIGVKVLVMVLGVLGVAQLWEAVFADSGVALLAVLNATRIFLYRK